jgi:hypothetical protein
MSQVNAKALKKREEALAGAKQLLGWPKHPVVCKRDVCRIAVTMPAHLTPAAQQLLKDKPKTVFSGSKLLWIETEDDYRKVLRYSADVAVAIVVSPSLSPESYKDHLKFKGN